VKYFKHPNALVESEKIGDSTDISAFVHVLPFAIIGSGCSIGDHVLVDNDVVIGDRVSVKCGVHICSGTVIEDDVCIAANATFTTEKLSDQERQPATMVRKGASIGANATIYHGVTVGMSAMVGAGAVVTGDVPPFAIVLGNPARITGYVASPGSTKAVRKTATSDVVSHPKVNVSNVRLYNLPVIEDLRGVLSFGEYGKHLPFIPKRYFIVFDVTSKEIRGEHAHKELHQFLVCVKGSCSVMVDDGTSRDEVCLDSPGMGLHIPPMVWATQYKHSSDAVLMVLASDVYKADDYIRDYDEFMARVNQDEA
jgi:UDP-2-acetamido-3-amino-2,3-dideoxy-glucuronate N-acetyltransferase